MANKKLIEDLKTIESGTDWDNTDARSAAGRALEEIEYLDNLVREKQAALDWYDFEPGDMK